MKKNFLFRFLEELKDPELEEIESDDENLTEEAKEEQP
jgi:hypothetical protein